MWDVTAIVLTSLLGLVLLVPSLALVWLMWRTRRLHRRGRTPWPNTHPDTGEDPDNADRSD